MDTTPTAAPPAGMSAAEWDARVDLAALYRLVDLYGWSDLFGTHISHRVPDAPDRFLINPFGVPWEEMTASVLIKVAADGTVLDETDYAVNPAGYTIHSALLGARPDVNCAIHTHTLAAVGVGTQKDGLLPLTQHALHVIAETGYYDYGGIETDPAERDRIAAAAGSHKILFLRNHGLITMGATPGEAFMWMYRTERACRMQLAIQQAGAEWVPLADDVIEGTIERNRFLNSERGYRTIGVNEWPALKRRLDRIDPSYRT